jgi:hypothetical protein
MKRIEVFIFSVVLFLGCNSPSKDEVANFPILKGKYLGQSVPDTSPEIFAPDIISTGMAEINAVFSSDFKEFYYSIIMPNGQLVIMVLKNDGSKWTQPEVAPFSGEYSDADPFITYDGNMLYFISKRPVDSTQIAKSDWDIWRVEKENNQWSEPVRLSSDINSEKDETYPSLTQDGKLYFSSARIGKNNKDIFCAESTNDGFEKPVRLSDVVNSHWEGDIFISPKEDYMIFASYGRDAGSGLYITFMQDGQWRLPQRMSEEINVTGREFCPIVSPDGKYFFYTSNQSVVSNDKSEKLTYKKIMDDFIRSYNYPQMGKTDIYWADVGIIEKYRSQNN